MATKITTWQCNAREKDIDLHRLQTNYGLLSLELHGANIKPPASAHSRQIKSLQSNHFVRYCHYYFKLTLRCGS